MAQTSPRTTFGALGIASAASGSRRDRDSLPARRSRCATVAVPPGQRRARPADVARPAPRAAAHWRRAVVLRPALAAAAPDHPHGPLPALQAAAATRGSASRDSHSRDALRSRDQGSWATVSRPRRHLDTTRFRSWDVCIQSGNALALASAVVHHAVPRLRPYLRALPS
jgi:hypothetical protein